MVMRCGQLQSSNDACAYITADCQVHKLLVGNSTTYLTAQGLQCPAHICSVDAILHAIYLQLIYL